MVEHPYGWLSILPPLVAIVLAIATRRVVVSLIAGVFVGALVTSGWNPWVALCDTWETHLWKTLIDADKMRVFSFTLFMGRADRSDHAIRRYAGIDQHSVAVGQHQAPRPVDDVVPGNADLL